MLYHHVHVFFVDISILKEKKFMSKTKKYFLLKELSENCTSMIKVSMVPQVIICTSKVIPVSNTRKRK